MLRERFGVSERRACTVVRLNRSTQRLDPPPVTDEEAELRTFLRQFSKQRPRWGWRRAAKEARRQGRHVNDKRVRRLWRDEGLRVPTKRRKKRSRTTAYECVKTKELPALRFRGRIVISAAVIDALLANHATR